LCLRVEKWLKLFGTTIQKFAPAINCHWASEPQP